MFTESSSIIRNTNLKGNYYRIDFLCEKISPLVKPGQFVHVQIKNLRDKLFRRPFSVFDLAPNGSLSLIYKVVGEGTKALSELRAGEVCDIMGPLGNSYSLVGEKEFPLIIAGGYGAASTYLIAKKSPVKGKILIGARNRDELILCDEYKALGFEVEIATDDGSCGKEGFVTDLLHTSKQLGEKIYGCGPNSMMYAIAKILKGTSRVAELSIDEHICCGVGACFGCVVKIISENKIGWEYKRSCCDGPVFKSDEIYPD